MDGVIHGPGNMKRKRTIIQFCNDQELNEFFTDVSDILDRIRRIDSEIEVLRHRAQKWPNNKPVEFQLKNITRALSFFSGDKPQQAKAS